MGRFYEFTSNLICFRYLYHMTYTLFNSGSIPLTWQLVSNATWISASPSSGSIQPQTTGSVIVNVNATASALPVGNYSASLQFVNTTTQGTTTRWVSLIVNPPSGSAILSVTPTSTVIFTGQVGGPFTVSSVVSNTELK